MDALPRHKKFLAEMPKNKNIVSRAAIKAGYSPQYADKQGKKILHSALKKEAREIADSLENNKPMPIKEGKKLMAELIGLSREEVMGTLKNIALQARDLNSALKVLGPISKEYGIILQSEDENKVNVPILNVVVREKGENTAQQSDIIKL
jgi:hypothetical protein